MWTLDMFQNSSQQYLQMHQLWELRKELIIISFLSTWEKSCLWSVELVLLAVKTENQSGGKYGEKILILFWVC